MDRPASPNHAALEALRANVAQVFLGQPEVLDRVICCLLARGHLLLEDVPGVGKTVLATALARSIDCTFSRIQLTPDLLPADILGVSVLERGGDRVGSEFHFKRGPIFANIVLADEINRTPPRTQSALLEAMGDGSVSVDGRTLALDRPFMVIATQNPYEFEGTYFLPENQLDRFLMRLGMGYPDPKEEARIIELRPSARPLAELRPVMTREQILELQGAVDKVRLAPPLLEYIVAFANATRRHEALQVGLSPRGSMALAQAARATALYRGRDYVAPDDITTNVVPVCSHRVFTRHAGDRAGVGDLLTAVLRGVPSPP